MNSSCTPCRLAGVLLALIVFSDARAVTVEAYTQAKTDLSLAMTVPGRAAEVLVREGDTVRAGQELLRLADPEGLAQLKLLEIRAASTLEADAAEADLQLARVREAMIRSAADRGGASAFEVREVELEAQRSELAYKLFLQRHDESVHQLEQARGRHENYTLRAPADGVIDLIAVHPGETVDALEPIVRLVGAATLVTQAQPPTPTTLGLEKGTTLPVTFLLGEKRQAATGVVVYLANVADAASDTRRVRVEIPNDHDLPAGTRVLIEFPDTPPAP